MSQTWVCSSCGSVHDTERFSWAYEAPALWWQLDDARRSDGYLDSDMCTVVDDAGRPVFLRCVLEVPIEGADEPFSWGVWGSLSDESFRRALDGWEDPGGVEQPSYFSWLSNELPGYDDTINLPCSMETRPVELRPFLLVQADADHALGRDQRHGISYDRACELAETALHRSAA